jgi:Uma2 family endonuclease
MELRSSESDPLVELEAKMEEYVGNGAKLGWLIDPVLVRLSIYRPGKDVEVLERPAEVASDPELEGFRFDMTPIWA